MKENSLVTAIDAILPQTQCRRCGFSGCRPYAEAIADGLAAINQCPPGGDEGIRKLAALLRVSPIPLDTAHGIHKPKAVAFIDEQACIGCTLCVLACPVDAIVGAAKQTHTVIAAECTGCELCIAPCPMDCISMLPAGTQVTDEVEKLDCSTDDGSAHGNDKRAADRARARHQYRLQRLEREKQEKEERLVQKAKAMTSVGVSSAAANLKKATIQAALARAMAAQAEVSKEK